MTSALGWKSVRAQFLDRIRSGAWPAGSLIPTEAQLAADLGCARVTVNRALQDLAEQGLLERKRRAGTRVVETRSRQAQIDIPLVRLAVLAEGRRYGYRLLEQVSKPLPSAVLARFHGQISAGLYVECLHLADGQPYQLEQRWINTRAIPAALTAPFSQISPNEWLLHEVPLTEAEHAFAAARPNPDEGGLLGLSPGEPMLVIERRTFQADTVLTFTRLCHPGDRFRLTTRGSAPGA